MRLDEGVRCLHALLQIGIWSLTNQIVEGNLGFEVKSSHFNMVGEAGRFDVYASPLTHTMDVNHGNQRILSKPCLYAFGQLRGKEGLLPREIREHGDEILYGRMLQRRVGASQGRLVRSPTRVGGTPELASRRASDRPSCRSGPRAECASEASVRGHVSEGLAVARSERAGRPRADERTATVAPLLSLPLPDDHRVPLSGG